jgi:hypothetical protein
MNLRDLPYATDDLFPKGDFAFHMRFRRGEIPAFYKNFEAPNVLAERRHWLSESPQRYAAALPDSEDILDEALEVAGGLDIHAAKGASPLETMLNLGAAWEPDLLLLRSPSPAAQPQLLAGAVCFPSSWALEEKIGHGLDAIHAPVPTLNEQFARPVQQFLARIKPGLSWERVNWGLSRSAELNQHPARKLPRLDAATPIGEIHFRAEYQSLIALPKTNAVLFGIRLVVAPLAELRHDAAFAENLTRAVRSMPDSIAAYKGLFSIRDTFVM